MNQEGLNDENLRYGGSTMMMIAIDESDVKECDDSPGSARTALEGRDDHRISMVGALSQKDAYLQCYYWIADQVSDAPNKRLLATQGCEKVMGCYTQVANAQECKQMAGEVFDAFNASDSQINAPLGDDEGRPPLEPVSRPHYMYTQGSDGEFAYAAEKVAAVCEEFH